MLNQQLISSQIEPLQFNQSVQDALHLMNSLEMPQAPVVNEGIYLGLIQEEDLLDAPPEDLLSAYQFDFLPVSVLGTDHFLSAARLAALRQLKIIPVVSNEKEFIGAITSDDLLRQFFLILGVQERGGLLVLSMDFSDYSLGQLSKLVETNDAFITQLNTYTEEVTGKLIVTLRINKEEISDIVATLQRYDYQVIFHAGEEQYENELRRNYNHLMNFLEM
jgi:Mg/Co/Ni transporter MgtE